MVRAPARPSLARLSARLRPDFSQQLLRTKPFLDPRDTGMHRHPQHDFPRRLLQSEHALDSGCLPADGPL